MADETKDATSRWHRDDTEGEHDPLLPLSETFDTPFSLTKLDLKIASNIFNRAINRSAEKRAERFMDRIGREIDRLRVYEDTKKTIETCIDILTRRILALQAGEYSLKANDEIVYTDATLNRETFQTPQGTHTI